MNIRKVLFALLFVFIPFIVNAETCNPEKVTIESIAINNKTDNVIEKAAPEVSGKNLNLNLEMFEVGDTIEYTIVVKNDSSEDYELDRTSLSKSSDFIEYILESKDNSTIIKAGESKEVLVKVQYKNQVSDDSYVNGVYTDNKNLAVNLSSESNMNPITNPKTGTYTSLIILPIFVLSCILTIVLRRKKYGNILSIILGLLILVPVSVYAICKCEINVDSKVEVLKAKKVCIYVGEGGCASAAMSKYQKKMIFVPLDTTVGTFLTSQRERIQAESPNDYSRLNSGYFVKKDVETCEQGIINNFENGTIQYQEYYNQMETCHSTFIDPINESEEYLNSPVKDESEGCYNFTFGSIC